MLSDGFSRLREIIKRLRGDNGCPWDRIQTPESLRPCIIEETYEIVEAVDKGSPTLLKEELGDLLLHILFYSQMMEEEGKFTIDDVIAGISDKLIRRHPHVFGAIKVNSVSEVLSNWENIKLSEKNRKSLLDGIPSHLPALIYAQRVQEKVSRVGFDWNDINGVLEKVEEELKELKEAIQKASSSAGDTASPEDNKGEIEEELGDLIFVLVSLARFYHLSAEFVLRKTVRKFTNRFGYIERKLNENKIDKATLKEMDTFWEESKRMEKE